MFWVVSAGILVVTISAVLSIIETAIMYVDDLRLTTIVDKGTKNAKHIQYLIQHKDMHLSSVVVLNTIFSIAGSSMIGAIAAQQLDYIGVAVFTGLLTYCMLVFAKILPKLLGVQCAESVLAHSAHMVRVVCWLLKPALKLTLVWAKLFNVKKSQALTRDELRSIIKHYNKSGVIGKHELKIAEQALKLDNKSIASLVSGSSAMTCLPADACVAGITELIQRYPHKRYPVIRGNEVCGIVLYRHIVRCIVSNQKDKKVSDLASKVVVLDDESSLLEAFQAFKKTQFSVGILPASEPELTRIVTAKKIYRAILQAS